MDTAEIDQLVVQNLSDLDAAAKRINEIEKRIWRDIGSVVRQWAKLKGWGGEQDSDGIWVHPPEWRVDGEIESYFDIGWGPEDTGEGDGIEPYFELSRLAGVNGGRLCLWFEREGIGARAWKRVARDAAESLAKIGLLLDDKASPYIDCTPSQSELAAGLAADDLTQALEPVRRALDQAAKAKALLGKLLSKARKG